MVPQSMHKEMLRKIHANHFGAESNIRMAREVLFWPGMRKSIQDMCDAKPQPRHRGKPWIYGEVIKTDNGRSYTVRTSHGTLIRRNRVQLKLAAAPPTFLLPQAALNPATVATTAYPTLASNPLKRTEVHLQSEQQTLEQSNTTAEVTQEPTLIKTQNPGPSPVVH